MKPDIEGSMKMAARIDRYEPEDLEMTWGEDAPAPERPSAPRKAPRVVDVRRRRLMMLGAALVAIVGLIFGMGACAGSRYGRDVARDAVLETASAVDSAEQAADAAAYWQHEAEDASATASALAIQLEDETARAEQYRLFAEEASATIAALKGQVQQQKATPKPEAAPKVVQASWSGSVESWRPLAEKYFGPLGGNRVNEALLCISIETGGTGNPNAVSPSGKYVGLFQMDSGWGTYEQRTNPEYVFACAASSVAKNGSWKQWPPMVARGL